MYFPDVLGKLPPKHDPRTLLLDAYTTPDGLFTPPSHVNWGRRMQFPMLGNSTFGDCVEAAAYHQIQVWMTADGTPVTPTEADTLRAYHEITGFTPADPGSDQGTSMLDALNYWRHPGLPWQLPSLPKYDSRHVITGFAKLATGSVPHAKLAISEFGGLYIGAAMPVSARHQFETGRHWTAVAGPEGVAGGWGGHAVNAVGYDSRFIYVSTWGIIQPATWTWYRRYCDESFAVLSTDWTGADSEAPSGVDFERLRADIAAIS